MNLLSDRPVSQPHRRRTSPLHSRGDPVPAIPGRRRLRLRRHHRPPNRPVDHPSSPKAVHAIRIPPRSPQASAFAERWVRTLRHELLDRTIIWNERQLRRLLDNLNRFVVPNVAGPARLVPLAALADDQFSVPALRQAAQRGRLDATQGPDGIWRSSRNAINNYTATKHTRRPKAT